MLFSKKLDLQLFGGEGTGGEGASSVGVADGASGVSVGETASAVAVDDGQQRLRELGVPEDKLKRRAMRAGAKPTARSDKGSSAVAQPEARQDAAAAKEETQTEESKQGETAPARMSWDEIMKDPEYNSHMQETIKSRLKASRGAEEAMKKLTPAIEVLARAHGLDMEHLDYDALAKAVSDDSRYYEEKALELGTSVETAKHYDRIERENARIKRENAINLENKMIAEHFTKLEAQGEVLKAVFPGFDLRTELKNPAFARMTSPNVGLSVEDAYYAVHRKEIQAAAMQVTAEKTAEKLSKAIATGGMRPTENGTSGSSASVTRFDYRKASPEERAAFKQNLREHFARGEKVYPGR